MMLGWRVIRISLTSARAASGSRRASARRNGFMRERLGCSGSAAQRLCHRSPALALAGLKGAAAIDGGHMHLGPCAGVCLPLGGRDRLKQALHTLDFATRGKGLVPITRQVVDW